MSSKYPGIIEKANKTSDFTVRLAFLWYYLHDLFQFDCVSLLLSFINNLVLLFDLLRFF